MAGAGVLRKALADSLPEALGAVHADIEQPEYIERPAVGLGDITGPTDWQNGATFRATFVGLVPVPDRPGASIRLMRELVRVVTGIAGIEFADRHRFSFRSMSATRQNPRRLRDLARKAVRVEVEALFGLAVEPLPSEPEPEPEPKREPDFVSLDPLFESAPDATEEAPHGEPDALHG